MPTARNFRLIDTQHMLQRAAERNIPEALAYEAISTGSQHLQPGKGIHGGSCWLYKLKHGGKVIVVAAEVVKKDCYILTVYAQTLKV